MMVVVVMGVSGSGKSTLGAQLAAALGWDFQEGDDLHPPSNVAKMAAGTPLTDEDRWPWLDQITAWMHDELSQGRGGVVSCSALKRSYRDRLRRAGTDVRIVYVKVARDELLRRMQSRQHFMPASLLDSQLATLQEPDAREEPDSLTLDGQADTAANIAQVRRWLGLDSAPG